MIFIKKTSKLFDKKETEKKYAEVCKAQEEALQEVSATADNLDDAIWEPKNEEEIKQKAAIVEIRKLLGQDANVPIKVSDIKKLESERLEAEGKVVEIQALKPEQVTAKDDDIIKSGQRTIGKDGGNEIWVPETDEEKLQHASMLKIRELLGQDMSVPIKKSEIKKTEAVKFVPPKPIIEEIVTESADNAWKPQTEEEKRQYAAMLKIRELLGEDTTAPIEKKQVKTQMLSSIAQEEEPVKRDPKAIIRCGDEKEDDEEVSAQYLLLKKLLEEDDKAGAKKPASGENSENPPKPATVSPFGVGNAFTIGAIRDAEPLKKTIESKFAQTPPVQVTRTSLSGSANSFSSGVVLNAESKPVNKNVKEEKGKTQLEKLSGRKIYTEEQEYVRPPEAANPNSGFFMFNFKELMK